MEENQRFGRSFRELCFYIERRGVIAFVITSALILAYNSPLYELIHLPAQSLTSSQHYRKIDRYVPEKKKHTDLQNLLRKYLPT